MKIQTTLSLLPDKKALAIIDLDPDAVENTSVTVADDKIYVFEFLGMTKKGPPIATFRGQQYEIMQEDPEKGDKLILGKEEGGDRLFWIPVIGVKPDHPWLHEVDEF